MLASGCSLDTSDKIQADTYYGWLASATHPVVQREVSHKNGGILRVDVADEKGEFRFRVSRGDLANTSGASAELRARAFAYQAAFLQGAAIGFQQAHLAQAEGSSRIAVKVPIPPEDVLPYKVQWEAGWRAGYRYGFRVLYLTGFPGKEVALSFDLG